MEANPIHHQPQAERANDDDLDPWNLGAGRSFVRLRLFCAGLLGLLATLSTLVKLVFLEGRCLDASMLLPLHRGTTPHLPIGDHHACALRLSPLRPGLISSIVKHWLIIRYLAVASFILIRLVPP